MPFATRKPRRSSRPASTPEPLTEGGFELDRNSTRRSSRLCGLLETQQALEEVQVEQELVVSGLDPEPNEGAAHGDRVGGSRADRGPSIAAHAVLVPVVDDIEADRHRSAAPLPIPYVWDRARSAHVPRGQVAVP